MIQRLATALLASVSAALMVVACASQPSRQTIERVGFTANPETITDAGLTVAVSSIGVSEMIKDSRLNVRTKPGSAFILLSSPAFRIQLSNQNEHIIRFEGAVIKLADRNRNLYDSQTKKSLMAQAPGRYLNSADGDPNASANAKEIRSKISNLKILDDTAVILPTFSGTYFVSFDLPQFDTALAMNEWIKAHEPFTLMFFDVVTATGAAGEVSKKSRFEFQLDAHRVIENWANGVLVSSSVAPL